MMLIERVAAALEGAGLHAALAPWVPPAAAAAAGPALDLAVFSAFYLALFLVSLAFWRYVVGFRDRRTVGVLASCILSSVHSVLCSVDGYQQLWLWHTFQLDAPNTPAQRLLTVWSLAYMLVDFFAFLLPFTPNDAVFIVHHSISVVYIAGCLLTGRGAISCIFMFFLGEVTSPVFNTFGISKELRHHSKVAHRVFEFTSPIFTAAFVGVRSVIAPPIIAWFVYTMWFRSPALPLAWRVIMGSCVTTGTLASQLWSFKLLQGYFKLRRSKRQQLSTAQAKAA